MGVISKNDRLKGLFNASSEESLHISEQSEDEIVPPPPPPASHNHPPQRRRVRPVPMAFIHLRKCLGKKKSRRYQDVSQLMTLAEEDEMGEVSIDDLAPGIESQFARLLGDGTSFATWNEFAESSEEAQRQMLEAIHPRENNRRKKGANGETLSGEDAFLNIDASLRTVLRKGKVPLGLLSYMEQAIVLFFKEKPIETFVSENLSSFERLLLHAVSQYHQLYSQSVDMEDSSQSRCVHVVNPHHDFRVPKVLLGEFLAMRRIEANQH